MATDDKRIPILDDIRFWAQIIEDGKRTILCSPEWESRVKSIIDARGLSGMLTVQVSNVVPDDQIFVLDENALAASMAKPLRMPRLYPRAGHWSQRPVHWRPDIPGSPPTTAT